jgi:hypothetical protein
VGGLFYRREKNKVATNLRFRRSLVELTAFFRCDLTACGSVDTYRNAELNLRMTLIVEPVGSYETSEPVYQNTLRHV